MNPAKIIGVIAVAWCAAAVYAVVTFNLALIGWLIAATWGATLLYFAAEGIAWLIRKRRPAQPDPATGKVIRYELLKLDAAMAALDGLDCDWCHPPMFGEHGDCTCDRKCTNPLCPARDTTIGLFTAEDIAELEAAEDARARGEQP